MVKNMSCYQFYFYKLYKTWRRGKAPTTVTYQEYTQNESLRAVSTLEEYIANREVEIWRRALSTFVKFYSPSQTSGFFHNIWVKTILMKSGIDTCIFKAHSTRFASTSKASLQDASIDNHLETGILV